MREEEIAEGRLRLHFLFLLPVVEPLVSSLSLYCMSPDVWERQVSTRVASCKGSHYVRKGHKTPVLGSRYAEKDGKEG